MKDEKELVKRRNYSVIFPTMNPYNYAYVGLIEGGNHLFTRPGSINDEAEMRIIEIKPEQVIEVRDHGITIEDYLLDLCNKKTNSDKYNELNKVWEDSLK